MLNLDETVAFFDEHYAKSAFRLETLDSYNVESDGDDVARYLAGEPEPDPERKQPWLEELAAERAAGKRRYRVRVLSTPLSNYDRYACEWGYAPNTEAGEEVNILDVSETPRPPGLVDEDFWLLDDEYVLRMVYDKDGRFVGVNLADDIEPYRTARDAALAASEDFVSWWARHPEEWRVNWSAA